METEHALSTITTVPLKGDFNMASIKPPSNEGCLASNANPCEKAMRASS